MFAIPFNFPFRKSNGDMSTIGAEINAGGGGGGGSYTLPTASATTKGGIKIGAGLSMDGEVLNNTNPTPATPYSLPTASVDTLGGVKVGSGLSINENGVLSASGGGGSYTLPTASADTLGGVKVGSGLSINENGVLSATGGGGGTFSSEKFTLSLTNGYTALSKGFLMLGLKIKDTATGYYQPKVNDMIVAGSTPSAGIYAGDVTKGVYHFMLIPMNSGDVFKITATAGSTNDLTTECYFISGV